MDELSRQRVRKALEASGAEAAAGVAALASAEQLHQYALNVNVNDGLLPIRALAGHPACDRGTALLLFWQFADDFDALSATATESDADPEWDAAAMVRLLATRLRGGRFRTSEIAFDPTADMTRVDVHRYRQRGLEEFLVPVVGRAVEREWLL